MIGFPCNVRTHLALDPHDMRKSFNGHVGHAAATIFTVFENCRRHGIEPEACLAEMLNKMPVTHDPAMIARLRGLEGNFSYFHT